MKSRRLFPLLVLVNIMVLSPVSQTNSSAANGVLSVASPVRVARDNAVVSAAERIAFVSNLAGNREIYVMNPDGTSQTRVTYDSASDTEPAWSPDGLKIAFTSDRHGNSEIYVMDANGNNQQRLTTNASSDLGAAWSPDGSRIAFSSTQNGNSDIYLMDANGSNQQQLTADAAWDGDPAWSPGGTRITFASSRNGNSDIFVMNADGSNQQRLTTNSVWEAQPAWSPDGSRIAYLANFQNFAGEIRIMNSDGTNQHGLVGVSLISSFLGHPSWSPDSAGIVYASLPNDNYGDSDIYVISVDGTNNQRLTYTYAPYTGPRVYNGEPAWSPAPSSSTFDCGVVTEIPQTECQALVALYNSTNGAGWLFKNGWLVTNTPCQWGGIVCYPGEGRVGALDLAGNHLAGNLPTELGNLVNLRNLNLSANQLSGNLPSEFGNLVRLQRLQIGENPLSGPLPHTLISLTALSYFDFRSTTLCEPGDAEFQNWLARIPNLFRTGIICTFSISGRVTDKYNNPIFGVNVTAIGPITKSATTSSSGYFVLGELAPGTYNLTPSLSRHVFTPPAAQITGPPDAASENFVAQPAEITFRLPDLPASQCLAFTGDKVLRMNVVLDNQPAYAFLYRTDPIGEQALGYTDSQGILFTTYDRDALPWLGTFLTTFRAVLDNGTRVESGFPYSVTVANIDNIVLSRRAAEAINEVLVYKDSIDPGDLHINGCGAGCSWFTFVLSLVKYIPVWLRYHAEEGDLIFRTTYDYTSTAAGVSEVSRIVGFLNRHGNIVQDASMWCSVSAVERKYIAGAIVTRLASPAKLYLTDPLGRHTGIDPNTGAVVNEIPGAFYTGPDTEPQLIAVFEPITGTYSSTATGTGSGAIHFDTWSVASSGSAQQESTVAPIAPGLIIKQAVVYREGFATYLPMLSRE